MAVLFRNSSGQCLPDTQVCTGEGDPFPINYVNGTTPDYNSSVYCSGSGYYRPACLESDLNTGGGSTVTVLGIKFSADQSYCKETAELACNAIPGAAWYLGSCYPGDAAPLTPQPCIFSEGSSGSGSSVSVNWEINSLNFSTVSYIFTGLLLLWATGLGIGLLISNVRKTRVR